MPHKQTEEQAKRAFTHGSGGAAADMATDPKRAEEQRSVDAPHKRPAQPTPDGHLLPHGPARAPEAEDRQEALLDEAIEETFPGSDPISPKHIT